MLNGSLGSIEDKCLEGYCYPPAAGDWEKVELLARGELSEEVELSKSSWRQRAKSLKHGSQGVYILTSFYTQSLTHTS
jgi:hypothetical protein